MMTELRLRKKTKDNQEVLQPLQNLSKAKKRVTPHYYKVE